MIPKNWRFHIVNNIGVTVEFSTDAANNTLVIMGVGVKFTDGAVVYGGEETLFAQPSADVADMADAEGSANSNASGLFIQYHCEAQFTTDAATPDGTIDIYVEWSTDGTNYPSDAEDWDENVIASTLKLVAKIPVTTADDDITIPFVLAL